MKACLSPYIFVFVLLLLGQAASAQQTNPFDVKTKKASADTTLNIRADSTAKIQKKTSNNPFDIKSTAATSTSTVAPVQKQEISVTPPMDSSKSAANPFDAQEKVSGTNSPDGNPFDIGAGPVDLEEEESNSSKESARKKWSLRATTNHDTIYDEGFYLWPLLLSLLFLAGAVTLNRKALTGLYKSIANTNHLKGLQRSQQGGLSPFYMLLYGVFVVNLALFLYFGIKHVSNIGGGSKFLYVVGVVFGIYLFRHLAMWVIGAVFPFKEGISRYNFSILTFNIMMGLMLLPINAVIAFTPYYKEAIYAGLAICALMYIIRMFHGVVAVTGVKNINIYHFFIYLCATEIAPIVIGWKIISDSQSVL